MARSGPSAAQSSGVRGSWTQAPPPALPSCPGSRPPARAQSPRFGASRPPRGRHSALGLCLPLTWGSTRAECEQSEERSESGDVWKSSWLPLVVGRGPSRQRGPVPADGSSACPARAARDPGAPSHACPQWALPSPSEQDEAGGAEGFGQGLAQDPAGWAHLITWADGPEWTRVTRYQVWATELRSDPPHTPRKAGGGPSRGQASASHAGQGASVRSRLGPAGARPAHRAHPNQEENCGDYFKN